MITTTDNNGSYYINRGAHHRCTNVLLKSCPTVASSVIMFGLMVMMVFRLVMVVSVVLRVMRMVLVVYVRVEAVLLIGCVCHLPDTPVWLHHTIASVHHVTMPFFPLVFVILSVRVLDAVLVCVLGWYLIMVRKNK